MMFHVKHRLMAAGVGALLLVGLAGPAGARPTAGDPTPYLTIVVGRTMENHGCDSPALGVETLDQENATLVAAGVPDWTGTLSTSLVGDDVPVCSMGNLYPTLAQARALHAQGVAFVSEGNAHTKATGQSDAEFTANSCGSLSWFTGHGLGSAAGEFAWPGGVVDAEKQPIVASCFATSRQYGMKPNDPRSVTAAPFPARTLSVSGGASADSGCVKGGGSGPCYTPPDQIAAAMRPAVGTWQVVQIYHLVDGASNPPGTPVTWQCAGPRSSHWTATPFGSGEFYCASDWQAALDGRTGVIADPATVAAAYGRDAP